MSKNGLNYEFEQIPGCSGYDATKVKNLICYSTPLEKPTCHNIYKSSLLDECFSLPSLRCIKGYPTSDLES